MYIVPFWWSGHSIVNRGPERLLTLVHSLCIITNITQAALEKIESHFLELFSSYYYIGFVGRLMEQISLTLFKPAFFGSLVTRGGADLPPPSKNGCNGWEVQKLSWNLISYQD